MFWRKIKYSDDELGELTYAYGFWNKSITTGTGDDLSLTLDGSKTLPSSISVNQAIKLLSSINIYVEQALNFINEKDITEFTMGNGVPIFEGIYSKSVTGSFDLEFGLSNWSDASIIVHFTDGIPFELSLGD